MTREVEATEGHMLLMRDISKVVHDYQQKNPVMDGCELMAVLGAVAGACISSAPDLLKRELARASLVSSMDQAIVDFGEARMAQDK